MIIINLAVFIIGFLAIMTVVMVITCFVMFRVQFEKLESIVQEEFEKISPYFNKRCSLIKKYIAGLNIDGDIKEDMFTEVERILSCLEKAGNREEIIENQMLLGSLLTEEKQLYGILKAGVTEAEWKEFIGVQEDIDIVKNELNEAVRRYNAATNIFPSSVVAKLQGRTEISLYKVE